MTGNFGLLFLVFWPIIGAFLSYRIGRKSKRGRDYFANFVTIVEMIVMVLMAFQASNEHAPSFQWVGFGGFGIHFVLDGFRCVYAVITAFMWMMTTMFSREYFAHYHNRNRYYFFMLLTFGGTMGVFLSGNLLTTFLFFEVMSFTSYVMVIHDEKPKAQEASKTYMAVAVLGGLVMLMGIFLTQHYLGTTQIDLLAHAAEALGDNKGLLYLPAAFLLFGFGGKAGMYPLHIWLPNAHPAAPAPASALLSGVLTKTGVFGILVISTGMFLHDPKWGMVMLIIGVLGMFTGAFLAVFSIDLKRTLACSSMSQIGFILVGVAMQCILGEHNALAARGTLLHMVNHSLIKLVLFMMAGVVYMNLHELDLNKVRGFGRGKPAFTFAFLMGVLGIIGLPMWNGYISKTLLHESIVEQIWLFPDYSPLSTFYQVVESIFTLTGGLTTAYMIKIFVAVCLEKNRYNPDKMKALNGRYMNKTSTAVLVASAIILPILGFFPSIMMDGIGKFGQEFMHGHDPAHAVEFFAWANLRGAVASLSIGVIVYTFIVRGCLMSKDAEGRSIYINAWPAALDIEKKIYRPLLLKVLPFLGALIARTIGSFITVVSSLGYKAFMYLRSLWIDNTGKGRGPQAVQDARTKWEQATSAPLYSVSKMREDFGAVSEKMALASGQMWDDEQPVATVYAETAEAGAALHDGHDAEHSHVSKLEQAEKTYASFEEWCAFAKAWWANLFTSIKTYVGEPRDASAPTLIERLVAKLSHREPRKREGSGNEYMQVIYQSLGYSLLLFLVGFIVILLFVIL